jgi:ubiquinone/menaquinone biosynthesis C-methylase UbiE
MSELIDKAKTTNGHSVKVADPEIARNPEIARVGKWLIPGKLLSPESLAGYYNLNAIENKEGFEANDWLEPEQMFSQFQFLCERVDLNGKSILDVGAGNGMFYEFLKSKNIKPASFTAIDIAEEQIGVVKKRFPEIEAIADDFFKYEFEQSYDVVTMFGVAPCLKFMFPNKDRISALLRLVDRALRYANEGVAISFLNHNAYERAEEEHYEYVYYYPEELCTLFSGGAYEISTAMNDLVTNCYIHSYDGNDDHFRFNLSRIDEVFKIFK